MVRSTVVIHSARRVGADDIVPDAWVCFDGDRVAATGIGATWRDDLPTHAEIVDAAGRWLTPGFIDLHCHGGGGLSVEDGPEGIASLVDTHSAHGTTRSVCSLVSAPVEVLASRLQAVADAAASDPRVLGAHLEGPFLDAHFRGAHDPAVLRDADAAAIDALLHAANGTLV
ncbi:MAG: N-acetylglucosamine-6-phosphate deacetylase, partial [Microbacterium sp.]